MLNRFVPRPSNSRIVAALLAAHVVLAAGSMRHASLTWDESSYIGIGLQLLRTGDRGITALQLHPPLSYYANSLLLAPLQFEFDVFRQPEYLYHKYISTPLMFESGYAPALVLFLARVPFVIFSVLLGLLVYHWGKEIYGHSAAVLALFFYSFCPNILAHCRLATPDILLALSMTLALYSFGRYVREPSAGRATLAGIALGLSLLSKFTGLMLIPAFLFVLLMCRWRSRAESTGSAIFSGHVTRLPIILGVAFAVVWMGYGFQFGVPFVPEWLEPQAERLIREKPFWRVVNEMSQRGIRVPAYSFVLGVYTQLAAARGWKDNFLFGHISSTGWWYYYWAAFLIKTPLPLIVCIAAALGSLEKTGESTGDERILFFSIVPFLVLFSVPTKINIGIRYILPLLPLLCILAGRAAHIGSKKWKLALAVFCIWYAGSAAWIYPHYLAYFNELVGGPGNGYRLLVDSNLDWGQELDQLARYLKSRNVENAKIKYFGPPGVMEYYDLDNSALNECEPSAGLWVVSATYLQNLYLSNPRCHDWLRELKPKKVIGYSIFIYDVTEEEARRWREVQ